ncbi:MAG: LamG domain-containing protein, partial [Actinobacteria bacterium]|nr:LamG domain-containing protein [Actinomycetota bacterium]
ASGATSIADSSGNGTTGAVSGGVTFGTAGAISGDTNTAATFNGTSGVINLGNPTALQLSCGTVEAWVKTTDTDTSDSRTIAIKWMAYGISLYAGKPYVCDWNRGGTAVSVFGSTNVADGQWHHIAMTFESGVANGMRIYVDGQLDTVDMITVADQNHDAIIGAGNIPASVGFFNGTLDEVAIYDTAWTASQIQRRYHAGKGS